MKKMFSVEVCDCCGTVVDSQFGFEPMRTLNQVFCKRCAPPITLCYGCDTAIAEKEGFKHPYEGVYYCPKCVGKLKKDALRLIDYADDYLEESKGD